MIHYLKLSQSVDDHDEQVIVIETACGVDGDSKVSGATEAVFSHLVLSDRCGGLCGDCVMVWKDDQE